MYFARSDMEEEEEYICMQYFACPLCIFTDFVLLECIISVILLICR